MSECQLVLGDCLEIMRTFDANSLDSIVCDPPYGLSFMGKDWDHGVPGVAFWEATLRVAKPGAFLLAFGGDRTHHRLMVAIEDAGWEIRTCLYWLFGSGFPKSLNLGDGWGTALKPAAEIIVMARKPLVGTVAENVLAWGTGGINVDATRIMPADQQRAEPNARQAKTKAQEYSGNTYQPITRNGDGWNGGQGRWPANVLLDEEAARLLDEASGETTSSGGNGSAFGRNGQGAMFQHSGKAIIRDGPYGLGKGDTGGASRFFYVAKASQSDRGHDNDHPTVKPVQLLQYLCRLVTPPGGFILDPFMGSGSTMQAAIQEGFGFVGIEIDPSYFAIAQKRLQRSQMSLRL